jgi:hypothetical protein
MRTVCAIVALALPAAGCGDEDVGDRIPNGKATELESQLDLARANFDQDRCDDANTAVNRARTIADTLEEDGVGADVQDAVTDGIDNLGSLLAQSCEEEEPVETVPETTPEETITETTPEPTTPEPTTPEPTTPEPTTPVPKPEPPPAPDEEGGGRQFDPNADLPPGQRKKLEDGG